MSIQVLSVDRPAPIVPHSFLQSFKNGIALNTTEKDMHQLRSSFCTVFGSCGVECLTLLFQILQQGMLSVLLSQLLQ